MVSITKPYLKIIPDKLYVSRRSGIISFMLFIWTITVFTALLYYLSSGVFVLIIFILGEIIFGLDAFCEWEELILDKSQNLATFTKYSWCDKLFSKSSEKHTLKLKLSDIRHIGVSQKMGLFMLSRNGKTVTFSTRGLKRYEVQNLKRDINLFLNTTRLENTDRNSAYLGDHLLRPSDSDEYLRSLLGKCSHHSILQEVPFSLVQNQSTPSLGSQRDETIPESSGRIFKKRPYVTNIFSQNIHSLQMKHRRWFDKR